MRTHLLSLLLTMLCLNSFSQVREFNFSHLNEKNGLSDNIINFFLKDSRGILWIGTYNGLNRFDGSNFYTYKKNKSGNSIINEVVQSLCEDKDGNIWGGTDKGIFRFNPQENRFYNYQAKSYDLNTYFFNILCDKNGDIWATGTWSIFKFNKEENRFDEKIKLTGDKDSLVYYSIRKKGFQLDPSGTAFWFATSSGLYFYDIISNKISNYATRPGDSLFAKRAVSALARSPSGNFWFFDNFNKEIVSFDPLSKKILKKISIKSMMPNAQGTTLFEDRNHLLWFSSITIEILVIDLMTGKIQPIKNVKGDNRSIANNFFWDAYQDDDGTDWFGTHAGISRCNPEKTIYKSFHLADKIPSLKGTSIVIAEEDPNDKSIWLITRSSLLIHFSPWNDKSEIFNLLKAKPAPGGIKPDNFNSIDFLNNLIVISTQNGSWQLERGGRIISPFRFLPAGYENFICNEIVSDEDSVIYFNDNEKLLYWNRITGSTKLIKLLPEQEEKENKTAISGLELQHGKKPFVIIGNDRIAYIDSTNRFVPIKIIKDKSRESGFFGSLKLDAKNGVWVNNRGIGLYYFNSSTSVIKSWDESDGLASNRFHRIKIDKEGRVWCIFYNKISVFIPGFDKFYNFQVNYSENDLNYTNWISSKANGNMICAINNELFEFFPEPLEAKPGNGKPNISQVSVGGREYPVIDLDKLTLNPDENTIRFRFGLFSDKEVFPYQLEYKLDGAESKWTNTSANSEALYNNLAPGNYTFRIKARGINNAWETEESTFNITIKTPFYKTKWFIGLILILAFSILFLLYRYRISQKEKMLLLENKAQLLQKEKVLVMYENLKQQLNPHFLFNSLTSLSGLIETDQAMAGDFLEQMSGIYRYILKNGDNETVSLRDEIAFVKLYTDLQQTRFKKGLIINNKVSEEFYHFKIAPVSLQNMIENAIKHNIIDSNSPLIIDIFIESDYLVVKNNLQKKSVVETSNKKGMVQFQTLYSYLSKMPVLIEETKDNYFVRIPLL